MVEKTTKTSMELDWLSSELNRARSDHSTSLDHIIQVLTVGMAALAALFAISNFWLPESEAKSDLQSDIINSLFLLASVFIFCAVGIYCASVGFERVFRYHYMEELERRICKIVYGLYGITTLKPSVLEDKMVLGWNRTSAPFITANPRHQILRASRLHFRFVVMAFLFLIAAALCFVSLFIAGIDNPWVILVFVICIVMLLSYLIYGFIQATRRTREAYRMVRREAYRRYAENDYSDHASEYKEFINEAFNISAIRYLLYPRPKDVIKDGFIIVGAILGMIATHNSDPWPLVACIVVIDVLVYQARYQINDIRGISEDKKNPEADNRKRLELINQDQRLSIVVSLVCATIKVLLAIIISLMLASDYEITSRVLLAGTISVFVLAILYETARYRAGKRWEDMVRDCPDIKHLNGFCSTSPITILKELKSAVWIFVLVGIGYPLRIIVAALCYIPLSDFFAGSVGAISLFWAFILLGIASWLFGVSFVSITWAFEASSILRNMHKKGLYFYKPHIALMGYMLGDVAANDRPLSGFRKQSNGKVKRTKRPFCFFWDLTMLVCGGIFALILAFSNNIPCLLLALAIVCLQVVFILLPQTRNAALAFSLVVAVVTGGFTAVQLGILTVEYSAAIAVSFLFTDAAFYSIYFAFNGMNYEDMNRALFKEVVLPAMTTAWKSLFRLIAGKDAASLFYE